MAIISRFLLPVLLITQPEKGNELIKPTGKAKSMAPKAASESCNVCWILAILDAQLAKHSPAIKNIAPIANLKVALEYVFLSDIIHVKLQR